MLRFLLVLVLLSMSGLVTAQGLGVGGHVFFGQMNVPRDLGEYYDNNQIYGIRGMIGWGQVFLLAKYQFYNTEGKAVTRNLPSQGKLKWNQDFYSIGLRAYSEPESIASIYLDLNYVVSGFTEELIMEESGYEDFNQEYSEHIDGLGAGLGVSIKIKMLTLEGGAEYIFLNTPEESSVSGESFRVGGFNLTLGVGIRLQGKGKSNQTVSE